jgi:hypothetical protein
VPAEVILDTGALVSLLDRGQTDHAACRAVYESVDGPLVTTEAVVTEACHLLARAPGGTERCLEFLLEAGVTIVPATPESLRRALVLVRKYRDTPMDYADASLVVLAEDLGCDRVFTLDRRGFSTYRLGGRRGFRIVP